jgi:hypothetical protein
MYPPLMFQSLAASALYLVLSTTLEELVLVHRWPCLTCTHDQGTLDLHSLEVDSYGPLLLTLHGGMHFEHLATLDTTPL